MLNIKEIKEILPHRYPMLLIDRVTEMDIEDKMFVRGYKNVSANEAFFQGHYPNEPIMPGVLQIEALSQAGAVAILSMEKFKGKTPLFAGTNKVRFKNKVVPGDRLDLYCEIIKLKGPIGIGKGIATVDGKVACEAEILFAIG
ncbi:3-hydroxyacyl-ACP dehydratase FabZ [Clostridium saccharobutylicum]|uniref:3-hydroxyacyl-[acyl-carrier-protein] dehydratase n=1 Tax=Clostridium saccharobutylicum DSM 13864 TaxID=1345695 RepID=U5MP63_CLOSA|nr:3-hydroxyacyl-ACP dehydratase FabZ [Clostridium saccharobutylicum]AGX42318.1 3-hydroxyacyl-[acyl-carrier-protein] dehydratase FabZ [Clostridium saccharobutylicum DSM 13864]AQR89599.1 3-hydroxyacyl-[acyl-carrier-protein] dehydratase FabZ [Clostridium saccharobutylicum]AQR99501.1 3-hydroxyacyl-[acyl-carrier-protein] dehydratase FabZ [Clostridium saccharobutylicum]AQS09233.1 3-hydroxyacyl-[acyl-carrier-protein] dehydratase FabZ [Clostridium saccharobutylicum]AQS13487.1 3-hydroxyacyl-[acyl-carr